VLSTKINDKLMKVSHRREVFLEAKRSHLREKSMQPRKVRERRNMSHQRPLCHGASPLETPQQSSTIIVSLPSRGGISFYLDLQEEPGKLGNIAFEVSVVECATTPTPARFSLGKSDVDKKWLLTAVDEKMRKAEMNRQSNLKAQCKCLKKLAMAEKTRPVQPLDL